MMERLEKRLRSMEEKLNPTSKETFDLVGFITGVRTETSRLMSLTPDDYQKELGRAPHSEINRLARLRIADEQRFNSLSQEQKAEDLGYPNLYAFEFAEIQKPDSSNYPLPPHSQQSIKSIRGGWQRMTTNEFCLTRKVLKRNLAYQCHKCGNPFQLNDVLVHQGKNYYHKQCYEKMLI